MAAQLAAIREGGPGAGMVIAGLDEAGVAALREAADGAEADLAAGTQSPLTSLVPP